MPLNHSINRRTMLRMSGLAAASVGLALSASTSAVAATTDWSKRRRKVLADGQARGMAVAPGWTTANGWPAETVANKGGSIWTREVPGTPVMLTVRDGEARTLFEYVVLRFHLEIHELGQGDVVGFDANARGRSPVSNHASGTAINILPGRYPRGSSDPMFPHEVRIVRDILASCPGVVAWGGDLTPHSQGLFSLKVKPGSVAMTKWLGERKLVAAHLGALGEPRPLGA